MPYGSLYVGCEEHLDPSGTGSFYNEGEADIVVQHVFNLIYSGIHLFLFNLCIPLLYARALCEEMNISLFWVYANNSCHWI